MDDVGDIYLAYLEEKECAVEGGKSKADRGCKRCNTEGHRNPIHSNQIQEDPFSTSGEKLNDNGSGSITLRHYKMTIFYTIYKFLFSLI